MLEVVLGIVLGVVDGSVVVVGGWVVLLGGVDGCVDEGWVVGSVEGCVDGWVGELGVVDDCWVADHGGFGAVGVPVGWGDGNQLVAGPGAGEVCGD